MNQIFADILFFVGFFGAIAAVILDWQSSKNFIYQGLTEGNKFATDKYGYFDVKKNLLLSAVMMAAVGVAGFYGVFAPEPFVAMFAGVMCGIPILLRGGAYVKNIAAAKRGRVRQIEFLRQLKSYKSFEKPEEEIAVLFNPLLLTTRGGRTYYKLFGWIYSEKPLAEAVDELQQKLADLSVRDESLWFPK